MNLLDVLIPVLTLGSLCVIAYQLGRRSEQRQRARLIAREWAWREERDHRGDQRLDPTD